MTTGLHYEALAAAWVSAGRGSEALPLGNLEVLTLVCWLSSSGALKEGVSDDLKQFERACRQKLDQQQPRWLDGLLAARSACDRCGERYRLGNLALCSGCGQTYCYRCATELPHAPNGNPAHFCGGELVG